MQESVWELYCSLSICLNHFWFSGSACFANEKTVINQRRVEKSAFEDQSEENSVWIIQSTTLLGIFCNISFTPTVTSSFQVHTDAHIPICGATMLLRCHWCRNLAAVNCILHWIILTLSTLHIRASSCITLLWLCHNHKMSINYHKNGLVSSHQTVGRWFIFILTKLFGYQQPSCLCVKMEFVVGTTSLSCELFSLSKAKVGLKPMHPLQLHWAPRLWRPRVMVVGHVVHFCQIILALKKCRNGI